MTTLETYCLTFTLFLCCGVVFGNHQLEDDWVPIFPEIPDQVAKSHTPSDFSRRSYEIPYAGNSLDNLQRGPVNSVPKNVQSNSELNRELPVIKKEGKLSDPVYKLANLKQRAGVVTTNVLPYHPVSFSDVPVKRRSLYKSDYTKNGRGMDEIYRFINYFLDFIQPGNVLPPDFDYTTNPEELLGQIIENWKSFLLHYIGIASCIAIGVFLALLVPLVGLFICIFRCAGKCGAGADHYETKKDACKRGTLGFFFASFLVLVAFGVVISFVSTFNVEDGLQSLPKKAGDSRDDVTIFLSNTKEEVNTLMVDNFKELETALGQALDDCGNLVRNELARVSSAVAVDQLNAIVGTVDGITADLVGISTETKELERNAKVLKKELQVIRDDIRTLLDKCRGKFPSCADFERKFASFAMVDLDQQFEKIPEINDTARKLSNFLNSNIKEEILKGVESLNSISTQVDSAIRKFVEEHVKIQIKRSGESLSKIAQDIVSFLDKGIAIVNGPDVNGTLEKSSEYIAEYGPYRLYADLLACVVILVVFTTLSLGLMCGCCGRKPTSRHDGCGTRAAGGSWIKCGVVQIFLFFTILMSVVVAHFFVGAVTEKLVCDNQVGSDGTVRGPVFMEILDKTINVDQYYPQDSRPSGVLVSMVLSECSRNATIYEALKLNKVQNLSILQSVSDQLGISEMVNNIISKVQISDENFVILTDSAKIQLQELATSELSMSNYTHYSLLLENQITGIDLLTFSSELRRTADDITAYDAGAASDLTKYADKLERFQQSTFRSMQESAKSLKILAARIDQNVKFNETSIEDAVKKLVSLAEKAEEEIQKNGALMLQEVSIEFGKDFEKLIRDYAYRVGNYTEKEVGKCSAVSKAAYVPIAVLCRGVIDPWNGFWASVGWSLIFFLLCAIIGIALIDLYRKTEDYAPANTQPSYMYYAYGDRDNIPVSNLGPRPYDPHNASNYEGDYPEFPPHIGGKSLASINGDGARNRTSLVSPVDAREGRYQDAALKAWGGSSPPRYSVNPGIQHPAMAQPPTASQEYERPPPYYYPGPANVPN